MDEQHRVIIANDLCRSFNDLKAVAGVSFQVERGEIFGLLSPDGV